MIPRPDSLIWLDLEMTGLDPEHDRIIEIATVVTDPQLNVIAEGPVLAIHQAEDLLKNMDDWNTHQHNKSGLVDRVRQSPITERQAEEKTLEFLSQYVMAGKSPMCGNSICQDRRFIYKLMPKLAVFFHYRNLDVSSIKILAQHWAPSILNNFTKESTHLALQDIYDSIAELRYYREHFFKHSSF
ncbi:MAG: oligoribonuclease [Gammaproteobacteria bacterium]|nr:oligoribonuclease [Gammaproteobacteria bacterium]